jgi:RNA polymerase-binding transcription factor DksA
MLLDRREAAEVRAELLRERARLERAPATSAVASELHAIAQAIARLDSGDYGLCATCGQAIPFDRLVVMPATDHCVGCGIR